MKRLIQTKRANAVLEDPSAQDEFTLDDLMVREARQEQQRQKRGLKKRWAEDCGLVAIPKSLAERSQKDFFLLTWNIWFYLVSRILKELRDDRRLKTKSALLSLAYVKKESFLAEFGCFGFIFQIHQAWAADILNERFGLPATLEFPHPCPLLFYEKMICDFELCSKQPTK